MSNEDHTPASHFIMRDRDGVITVAKMRTYFELAVKGTARLEKQPLDVAEGDSFSYANHETNILWNGFALGMRLSERVAKATGE